jgi:peroxiredoxin
LKDTAMIRSLLLALTALLAATPALAQDDPAGLASQAALDFGPAVGDTAPAFSVADTGGAPRSLADLAGPQGLVLYFNRSLDWCPICLRQTIELSAAADDFAMQGWGVAVLTYDPVETLARIKDQRALALTLLSDLDSMVIDAFDVRDPIYADPGHMAYGVPYPLAVAIRPDGRIVGKYWHEAGLGQQRGYAVRVSAADVLADLP